MKEPTDELRAEILRKIPAIREVGKESVDALMVEIRAREKTAAVEALEKAANYVATHYPVHYTGQGRVKSEWAMDRDSDGGKIQQTYATAIRALRAEILASEVLCEEGGMMK